MTNKNRSDFSLQNQVVMYGGSPDWYPDVKPLIPNVTPEPFTPLPNLGTEMTTLSRLYNVEQEFNRLKVEFEELKKTLVEFVANQGEVNKRSIDLFVTLCNNISVLEGKNVEVKVKQKPAKKSTKKTAKRPGKKAKK